MDEAEKIAQARVKAAEEWAQVRQMSIYEMLIAVPKNRIDEATQKLIATEDHEESQKLRAEIKRDADIVEWLEGCDHVWQLYSEQD